MKWLLLFVCGQTFAADIYVYGTLGLGAYAKGLGRPEITTPNMLGAVEGGVGAAFDNDVSLTLGIEHWSSLQGFPAVFNSKDEDGRGFNAIWLKVEKRIYLK